MASSPKRLWGAFLTVVPLAAALACGDSQEVDDPPSDDPAPQDASTPTDRDADDAEVDAAGPRRDAGVDAGPVDAGQTTDDDAGVDAGSADLQPIDESCGFMDPLQVSPDGHHIAYLRCDDAASVVLRDVRNGTAEVIGRGPQFQGGEFGVLTTSATATSRAPWAGGAALTIPTAVATGDYWRIWQSPTAIRHAVVESVNANSYRFAFYESGSPTPVTSQAFAVTAPPSSGVIANRAGTVFASLEVYGSAVDSRLRVGTMGANAAVTTYPLTLTRPRWVPGGQVADGALLTAGLNASRLYYASFTNGVISQVSTGNVVSRNPPGNDPPNVLVADGKVFFIEGYERPTTIRRWDPAQPSVASTVHASFQNAEQALMNPGERAFHLSADGNFVVVQLTGLTSDNVGNGTMWGAVPTQGGASVVVEGRGRLGGPSVIAVSNSTESVFHDLPSGNRTTMVRGTPFVGPQGNTFFSLVAQGLAPIPYAVHRKLGDAASTLLWTSPPNPATSALAVPVVDDGLVLRLQSNQPAPGESYTYSLYLVK